MAKTHSCAACHPSFLARPQPDSGDSVLMLQAGGGLKNTYCEEDHMDTASSSLFKMRRRFIANFMVWLQHAYNPFPLQRRKKFGAEQNY